MIGYRDRTWCCNPECDNSCGRKFTVEDHLRAIKWWGEEGYPIAFADFHKKDTKGEELEEQASQLMERIKDEAKRNGMRMWCDGDSRCAGLGA